MTTALRTPGVQFTVVPPPAPAVLPRMDIAGFVGFAASGPINTPVPVEDPGAYAALFGDDLLLARDIEAATDVYANLGPAVRTFFREGGKRCWVVRAARGAQVSAFPVPGLVTLAGGSLAPVTLSARSAGAWADGLQVSTALNTVAVPVLGATLAPQPSQPSQASQPSQPSQPSQASQPSQPSQASQPSQPSQPSQASQPSQPSQAPQLSIRLPSDVVAGDLLQITAGRQSVMAFVSEVTSTAGDPPTLTATLDAASLICVRAVDEAAAGLPATGTAGTATLPGVSTSPTAAATYQGVIGDTVTVGLTAGFVPQPGQALVVTGLAGDEQMWMAVTEAFVSPQDPGQLRVQGTAQFVSAGAPADATAFAEPDYTVRLTFDLFAQAADGSVSRLSKLGFGSDHLRGVGSLPSDEELFALEPPGGSPAPPPALWADVTTPRWPLAASAGADYHRLYPIGMPVVPTSWLTAPAPAAADDGPTRNGLATFDSRLFVDDKLRGALTMSLIDASGVGSALLEEADYIRYTGPYPRALIGLHALLELDEVTLVAVPDAVQRPWTHPPRTVPTLIEPPDQSKGDGAFVPCAARQLNAPKLSAPLPAGAVASPPEPDPDRGGGFVLSWDPTDAPRAQYLLQQSVASDFEPATTFYEGPDTEITVHDLAGGQQPGSGQWFRVMATAGPAQSPWSNAVFVAAAPVDTVIKAKFSDATLIDVQRALLRAVAARGDMFAALALPGHYDESATRSHVGRLFAVPIVAPAVDPPRAPLADVPPLHPAEARTLSFGALYCPWTVRTESAGVTVAVPPDATAVALMAERALTEGAWVAPANLPLTNAVALEPALSRRLLPPGAVAQINVLSHEPNGFVCLSQWTLSVDPDLTDISVRRLLSLLRRVAMLWGPRHVFEPNDPYVVHAITRDFEALLLQLLSRGALAGDTPAQSFFVSVLSGADPANGLDPAELVVQIGVAPSLPMRFLTVQLSQRSGGTTAVGGT